MLKHSSVGLATKLNLLSTSLIVVTALSIAGVVAYERKRDGYDILREDGRRLAQLLARGAESALLAGRADAYETILDSIGAEQNVAYVELFDVAGRLLAQRSLHPHVQPPRMPELRHMEDSSAFLPLGRMDTRGSSRYFDFVAPVRRVDAAAGDTRENAVAGFVRLGVFDGNLQKELRSTFEWIFLVTTAAAVLGIVLTLVMTRRIIRPLKTLRSAAHDVAEGRLEVDLEVQTRDEVGDVAQSFRTMLARLRESRDEVARSKETLEATVVQRTHELQERARDLARTQERLGLALDGSNLALWDWDLATGRVFLSDRWNLFLGGKIRETVTTLDQLAEITHPDDRQLVSTSIREIVKGLVPQYRVEHRVRTHDGQWRWILSRGKVVERDASGLAVRAIGTNADITHRKHDEEELKRAKDHAEGATRSKSRVPRQHEPRDPHADERRARHDGPAARHRTHAPTSTSYAETVARAGESSAADHQRHSRFLEDRSRQAGSRTRGVRSSPTTSDVIDLFSETARRKGITLAFEIDGEVPTHAIGDPVRLKQVLANLVSNAIKFTHDGGVRLTAKVVERDDMRLRLAFSVHDSGIGIPAEAQEHIFQPFSQADGSTTRKYGGTGLGLSIVRQLVRLMGGDVEIESEPGQGATFRFEIAVDAALTPLDLGNNRDAAPRVLIIDPSSEDRSVLARHLARLGVSAEEVRTSAEATERLRAAETPFTLVLMERRLDDGDGLHMVRALRGQIDPSHRPRIVITSGAASRADQAMLAELDIAGWLAKPVRREALRRLLEQLFPGSLPARSEATGADRFPGARILLVEDNAVNQMVATGMLQGAGCRVEVAGNGREALDRLGRNRYDLVLMDCQMPEMDGYEATAAGARRRADGGHRHRGAHRQRDGRRSRAVRGCRHG